MSGLHVLSKCRAPSLVLRSFQRWQYQIPVRHKSTTTKKVSDKILQNGGYSKKGDFPGFPRDKSIHAVIPGETEEKQTIGNFDWLGEEYEQDHLAEVPFGVWGPGKRRTGAIGRKIGEMNVWDARGVKTYVTVVHLDSCQVVEVKKFLSGRGRPRINLKVAAVPGKPRRMKKSVLCQYRKWEVDPKSRVMEFPVSEDAVLPVGSKIGVRHFVPGQYVDIQGISKGKGFQGGMKRWGFAGQPASHGASKSHRSIGSMGGCQDPGRVWKGKKMAGHMGKNLMTVRNLLVYKMDIARDLLFIKGSLPGGKRAIVRLKDARDKPFIDYAPPFPTYEPQDGDADVDELIMDVSHLEALVE